MSRSATDRASKGFPLGALFLLVAVFATIIAQLCLLRESDFPASELSFAVFVRGIWGAIFGLLIGLHDFRRLRGALVGTCVGLVVGAATGLIALSSIDQPATSLAVATASGIVLVTIAGLYRALNSNDPVSQGN